MSAVIRTSAAALAAAVVVLLVVAALAALARPDDPGGAVLSDDDRRALAAVPALRGADAAPVDPAVDLTDPEAVARAYLVAAHSLVPGDTGHTQRRATGYARPGSPAAVGVVVLDPPPPGAHRTAVVTGLEPAGASGERRGYRAALRTETARPGGPVAAARQQALVVLARSPDGRWRVVAETTGDPDLPAGED